MISSILNEVDEDDNIIVGTNKIKCDSQRNVEANNVENVKQNKVQPVTIHVIRTQSSDQDLNYRNNSDVANSVKLDQDSEQQFNKSKLILNEPGHNDDDKQDSDNDMIDTNIVSDQSENLSQNKKNKRGIKSRNSLNSSQNQNKYYDISEEIDSQIKQIKDQSITFDDNVDVKEENSFDPDVY